MDQFQNKVEDLYNGFQLISKELIWILDVCEKKTPTYKNKLGREMHQKTLLLYKDFIILREKYFKLKESIDTITFPNEGVKYTCYSILASISSQLSTGLFKEFENVVGSSKK